MGGESHGIAASMANDLSRITARNADSGLIHVIIETPRGSRNKYKYDETHHLFMLHKHLPRGAVFPFDFGFIPSTVGEDGDPLDVLVLMDQPTFTGCFITVRLLGAIQANQTNARGTVRNDRLIGVPETDKIRPRESSIADLAPGILDEIEHFFVSYNEAEDRTFEVLGRCGAHDAGLLVDEAMVKPLPK